MSTDPIQYVTTVTPNDVLFGRGSGPNDHEGNIKFRDMVALRKGEYMATNHRQTKAKIAKEIVDTVFARNGRFLKKLEPPEIQKLGFDAGRDYYTLVDDETIMEKAKQALRQNRGKGICGTEGSSSPQPIRETSHPLPINNTIHSLPPSFVQGSNGNFQMPTQIFSEGLASYQEDADGYAEYTTSLDDPDDPEDHDFYGVRRMSTGGSRRGSLLGGRKDGSGPRRDSMQMADVWRRDPTSQSMQMSELMESFKGMSTMGDLNSSTDTIGTIEGDIMGKSQMSMSAMSMTSAASLFKSTSSDKILLYGNEDVFPGPQNVASWNNNAVMQRYDMPPPGLLSHRGSIQSAFASGSISNLLLGPLEGSSTALNFDAPTTSKQGQGSSPDRVVRSSH